MNNGLWLWVPGSLRSTLVRRGMTEQLVAEPRNLNTSPRARPPLRPDGAASRAAFA